MIAPRAHIESFQPPEEGCAVALGFFDGVHRGHRAVLERAVEEARRRGYRPLAFTFRNHPSSVLGGGAPRLLTTFPERVRLLAALGVQVIWGDFDRPFSELTPRAYAEEILRERLGARHVVAGADHRFGRGAEGDGEMLERLGRQLGFGVSLLDPVRAEGAAISSTRIRSLVASGEVAAAARLLGRPYRIRSRVMRGVRRGRDLGAPTANLPLPPGKVVPAGGVYAVRCRRVDDLLELPGVANLGSRPTFGGGERLLEVHLLDFTGDLYGQELEVDFVDRLRPERRFPDAEALRRQIARDVEAARQVLGG